jgi:hypothetical protein
MAVKSRSRDVLIGRNGASPKKVGEWWSVHKQRLMVVLRKSFGFVHDRRSGVGSEDPVAPDSVEPL